ncbi:uncharacterized protein LOC110974468 [Acanthaster planci]|uniref:Uncharacterized protein LOC110974468 n=1 Tax=Acanthaster planci TaxID=133434 RepID=A0A8B7XLX6_ACAPL|nr:uncharacterized protein LOC110974468 [Acanthaster planci]
MLTGTYSQKFKDLEQDRLARSSSSDSLNHAQQLAARDKVRQLSLETNRRRRAQELKRRLEAQKEAKRRQEVLEERRRRQQEATQRYQRGQRGSPKTGPRITSGKAYSESRLKDGVNMARGFSQNATHAGNYGNRAPALEEALRMVGVNTAPASSIGYKGGGYTGGTDYTTENRGGYSDTGVVFNNEHYTDDMPPRRPVVDSNGNTVGENKGHYYHGYSTTATATYNSNVNQEATGVQFQQTLNEKQKQLMEQQQAALNEFNQAVLNEALPYQREEELQRSSSLSSVDSLEEEQQKKNLGFDGRRQQPEPPAYKSAHSSSKPRNDGDSVDASVPVRNAYGNGNSKPSKPEAGHSAISDTRLFTSHATSEQQHPHTAGTQRGLSNGELLVEETSESDFVREPVETKPTLLHGTKELHSQQLSCGPHSTRTSQAWTESPQFHNAYNASHSSIKYTAGPVTAHAGHRPFSARTSATSVSSYPARVFEPPSDHQYSGQQKPEPELNKRTGGMSKYISSTHEDSNYVRSKCGLSSNISQGVDYQPTDGPTQTGSHLQEDGPGTVTLGSTLETPEKIVKSILKRSQGYNPMPQKVKLGGMKVKDSLEISRATQVTKADRKSVRWTDLKYNEADEVRSDDVKVGKEQKVSVESAKAESSNSTRIQQHDGSGRAQFKDEQQSASAGTPPRGPTRLQRRAHNASKPPPGRSNAGSSTRQVESENPQAVSRVIGKAMNHQPESSNRHISTTHEDSRVYQNGIRLDKTPTDEEINWLWDKVRTCLNTQEQGGVGPNSDISSRQPASMSKHCIDGNRLTANLRVSAQGHVTTPQDHWTNQRKYNTYPRIRTSSDSSATSLRKTALLQQRRQHSAVGNLRTGYQGRSNQHYTGPVPGLHPSPPSASHHQTGPTVSNQGPIRTASGIPHGQNQDVSDSLLAFQQAERLAAQEDLSESEIAATMEHQKKQAFLQKAPTALSLEEQRILESLDKLNAQLRTVTSETDVGIQPFMMQPKPPPQGSGFRSQRPISARQRAVADPNMTHRTRTLSADRSNARINYYH